ncbi:unnamed protein product [Rhizoctonia solani]|uniref:Uncharacterized protein n=1 Tax=Rhizoctonia solani TaxID=456999 RepID=A0A8H3D2M4_9AGAM|nr:unnamed protein product [Rhizoctonia solani]
MSDKVHLHWGRIIDNYDGTYVYDVKAARQQVALSPQVMDTLHTDGGEAIDKLYALGNSPINPDWNNASNRIPLPMLQSLVDYAVFPCSLPKLGNPLVVRGCIKLLKSITRFGRPSPFSYEYGHLCFRILMLAFDYCVMKLSDTVEDWMTEATQPKNQLLKEGLAPMLSKAVSELIDECIVEGDEGFYSNFTVSLPWTDSYKGPLVDPHDIRALTEILDQDRKHFMIFLRSNYSLRLSALLYTMFQVMHRTPPTLQNRPFIQAFLRVYMRSLLLAPGYPSHWGWQHQYVIAMSKDYQSTSQSLDTEDSKLVIRAYMDRLTILSASSPLHPRVTSPLAAELLQHVLPFVGDGCESLIPPMLCAIIRYMWQDLGENFMEAAPAEVVDACIRLFQHFKHLSELLVRNEGAHASILMAAAQTAFDERITELFGRLLLELFMTGQGSCDDDGPASALTQAFRGMSAAFHQDVAVSDLASRMATSSLLDLISREDFEI